MATSNLIYLPRQSKPARKKKQTDKKPAPKATVLEWIRNGCQFPAKVRS